ncbi:MAG: right-handed parallel beta-helix repeat-containing protein [Xanthomonadales bacterium]|nr:right-handed parallel beta-helix repeat-containing protein [Xanthomonadales bacterium]
MNAPLRRRRHPGARAMLLAGLSLAASIARADDYCVASSEGLRIALAQFVNQEEDTVIRLVQGSYTIQPEIFGPEADLVIAGGYTDSSCTNRSYDPSLTVLRPQAGQDSTYITGLNLDVASVSFRGFGGTVDLAAFGDSFGEDVTRITRVRFEGPALLGNAAYGDRVYLTEVIVSGSGSTDFSGRRCAMNVTGPNDDDDLVAIQHSVVASNPAGGLCIGNPNVGDNDGFLVRIDNSILFGNAMSLHLADTSDWWLRNTIADGTLFEYSADDPGASGGNTASNPLFQNAAGGDFRLQNASPAINSGRTSTWNGLPQLDIAGNPRWIGPAPDRGAYESAIDGTEVLTVTDAGDSISPVIPGSLRWAIQQANASANPSTILFNIPGACPRIIVLSGDLPPITSPVSLYGYSQPGSSANTLDGGLQGDGSNAVICVRIAGNGSAFGLRIPQAAGTLGRLAASGLSIGDFSQAAIALEAGTGSVLSGNFVGVGQPIGIYVAGSAEDTQVGGPDPWQRNVIQSSDYGIALNPPSRGAIVENNLVGLDADGNGALRGNDVGIGISGNDNSVLDNAIAGNGTGVSIFDGDRNVVRANLFGRKVGFLGLCGLPPLPSCPSRDLPNSAHGVLIQGSANDNEIESNTIANSGQSGIRATGGLRNTFFGNPIWNSGGLGVDLNGVGPDPLDNDAAPGAASLANRGLNAPAFLRAQGIATRGVLDGLLSTTNGQYTLEAYASPSCDNAHREMRRIVGYGSVTVSGAAAGASAIGVFRLTLGVPSGQSLLGQGITVIATEFSTAGGLGSSSEPAFCTTYTDDRLFADGFD